MVVQAVELLRERGCREMSLNFAAFAKWMHSPAEAARARCSAGSWRSATRSSRSRACTASTPSSSRAGSPATWSTRGALGLPRAGHRGDVGGGPAARSRSSAGSRLHRALSRARSTTDAIARPSRRRYRLRRLAGPPRRLGSIVRAGTLHASAPPVAPVAFRLSETRRARASQPRPVSPTSFEDPTLSPERLPRRSERRRDAAAALLRRRAARGRGPDHAADRRPRGRLSDRRGRLDRAAGRRRAGGAQRHRAP